MFQRLVFTFATAGSLIGLALLYSVAIRPVVAIPVRNEPQVNLPEYTEAKRPAENVRVAAKYIPFLKWATDSKYMLRAEQAFVYTQKWGRDETSNKRVTFEPFAMVWLTNDKDGNEQAVSIASDSATLEFAAEFDERNPNPGRVVVAILNGQVQIAGPDGLFILGENFFFEESALSLYTTRPVRFRFQNNFGVASRMQMNLIPAEGPPGLDRPHVNGIESVRLIGGENPVKLKFQWPQGKEIRPVTLKCAGDLVYTVATNTAVFSDDVRVWTEPKEKYDGLDCDRLTMQFVPKKVPSSAGTSNSTSDPTLSRQAQSPHGDFQNFETNLEFSWLEAEGKSVKVHSQAYGVDARMTRLTYDAETQILTMSSEDPRKNVSVVRNGSELWAPKIEAHLRLGEANPLASLFCLGKGEMWYVDEKTNQLAFVAKWKKQLSKKLDHETNLDLIELDEHAVFGQRDRKTGLSADLIRIWLVPMAFGLPSADGEQSEESKTQEPEPKRLLALGAVVFKSPQLVIQRTNELDIRFDDERDLGANTRTRRPSVPRVIANSAGRIVSKSRQVGFANIPAMPDGKLGPSVEIPSEPSAEPIVILANRIGVRLQRVTDRPEPAVKEVHSEGKVTITQERKLGEKPMRLEGDRVDVKTESETHEVVHVLGNPALIHDRGFEIEGKNIHLDRGANRAWVTGAGELRLVIPADTKISGLDANFERKLRVRWDESMNFDGLAAKFLGRVEAKFGLGKMHCEQMVVQLADRLSFQADNLETSPALQSVHCEEKVLFENSTYVKKKLVEIYRGEVSEFTVNYVSGDVFAQGPGVIRSWRRQKNVDDLSLQETTQANRPIPVEVTVWDYTEVQFEGKLKGHFDGQTTGQSTHRRAIVDDRVEVIHGPVNLPSERIDPDNLPSRAGTIRCDKLEFVNHPVSQRRAVEYHELIGRGNAEIEGQIDGQRFAASADVISYDGSKGLYVLHAEGPRETARLNGVVAGKPNNVAGRWIEFNPDPKLKYLRVVHATEGQRSQ